MTQFGHFFFAKELLVSNQHVSFPAERGVSPELLKNSTICLIIFIHICVSGQV